jgi:hypothetical protein
MLSKWKILLVAMAVLALGLGSAQAQTADDGTSDGSSPTDETGGAPEEPAEEPSAEEPPAEEPVELKVGPALTAGLVSFVLGVNGIGDTVAVEAMVSEPMGAAAKGVVVAEAVANADPTGAWQATNNDGRLTFLHLVGDTWVNADVITGFSDTTGSGTKVQSSDSAVAFTLTMDETAVAVGYDGMGDPSFITVTVTDTLTWTRALQGGETPEVLLDAFEAFLASEAGEGVAVTRNSGSSLTVLLHYEDSQVNWQVTDLGLESSSQGEALQVDDGAMLIRRGK